ncbi:MAG: hypothetical protein R3C59_31405 [Planctomycetaceae bacterium]
MSTQTQDPEHEEPVNERLAQLVGYLDGELDGTQMDLVEQQLINDPEMRSHADILSRTWALLDVLEDSEPAGQRFTVDTLATVSTEAVAEMSTSTRHRIRSLLEAFARHKVLTFFLAGVLGGAAGLGLARQFTVSEQNSETAADAIILEQLDMLLNDELYREVPDVTALKEVRLHSRPATDESGNR